MITPRGTAAHTSSGADARMDCRRKRKGTHAKYTATGKSVKHPSYTGTRRSGRAPPEHVSAYSAYNASAIFFSGGLEMHSNLYEPCNAALCPQRTW